MDKLNMKTKNIADENYAALAKLFPNALTETITGYDENGNAIVERAIDADVLRQEISCRVVEGKDERYQFTWPDKKRAIVNANSPINKTLRPQKEISVDFDKTKNIYIEGNNLDVLKLLQETYLNMVRVIYIDPPYNTGNDFIYNDSYKIDFQTYVESTEQFDEDGNRLVLNTESNGRFHTDWLNNIYSRLKLARNLLCDEGVIFISIDDKEVHNLRKICDEIFNEKNIIAEFAVASNSTKNNSKYVSVSHEYILCYAKNKTSLQDEWKVKKNNVDEYYNRAMQLVKKGLDQETIHEELLALVKYPRFYDLDHYTYADERGIYQTDNPGGVSNGNMKTEIIHPITGKMCTKPNGGWRYKDEELKRLVDEGLIAFGEDEKIVPRIKRYLDDYIYQVPKSILFFDSQSSTKWLKSNDIPFDFAKAVELMKYIISISPKDALIMDFYSGSATTAHAIMELNAEESANRQYILVQLAEEIDKKTEAGKLGYKDICELARRRIQLAAQKIEGEYAAEFDSGFRVLKLDSSNMKDVYYNPSEIQQHSLFESTDNIKEDRTPEDLLFQVMLDLGVLLSSKIEETEVAGKKIFNVADNFLVACFDNDITEETVKAVAQMEPYYTVFRDSCMANDSVATNFDQIFATYSPSTVRKVL